MAADRGRLHLAKLEEFAAWCETQGYSVAHTKGPFEVLRLVGEGRPAVVLYARSQSDHATVPLEGPVATLVRGWFRSRKWFRREKRAAEAGRA